ncbi:hypothetical protein [Photobacterium leiognathi]|uniref:hypothetical protein n=1 Tax=Photobacterium leiognathi TaxID=553611 RepID=UPI002982559F|nr:hypothetical protein [Photobacterium leiognathi]
MRKNIPICRIKNDISELSTEFIWSLRYSTHCIYDVKEINFDLSDYKYLSNDVNTSPDFLIEIKNGKIKLNNEDTKKINIVSDSFLYRLLEQGNKFDEISIYLLFNFNSECKVIGLLGVNRNEIKCLDHNADNVFDILTKIEKQLNGVMCDNLVNIRISKDEIIINHECCYKEFRCLRSCGINIPLVLVQNLYKRKIKTYKFIKSIESDYNIEQYKSIFFDLDETLVWQGEPIQESILLLKRLHDKKLEINLLTRHKKDIHKTLKSINVDCNLFNKIIKVEDDEKKSSFITPNSLFVDNEFPERFDVRFKANTVSLDLDQLEFVEWSQIERVNII